jgi:hypothetical protein
MPRRKARELARLLQLRARRKQFGESEMKYLVVALLLVAASSQFACAPLVAGGVGAAVGVAAERERQEDKDKD